MLVVDSACVAVGPRLSARGNRPGSPLAVFAGNVTPLAVLITMFDVPVMVSEFPNGPGAMSSSPLAVSFLATIVLMSSEGWLAGDVATMPPPTLLAWLKAIV